MQHFEELINPLLLHNTNSLINDFVSVNCKWFKLCIAYFLYFSPSYFSGKIGCDRCDIKGRNCFHSFPLKKIVSPTMFVQFLFGGIQLRMGCKAKKKL